MRPLFVKASRFPWRQVLSIVATCALCAVGVYGILSTTGSHTC